MNKLVVNNKVAVLYSPGYGSGWSTWNDEKIRDYLCMDRTLAQCVIAGDLLRAEKIIKEKHHGINCFGLPSLKVKWIDQGHTFEIEEHDGNEVVVVYGKTNRMVA